MHFKRCSKNAVQIVIYPDFKVLIFSFSQILTSSCLERVGRMFSCCFQCITLFTVPFLQYSKNLFYKNNQAYDFSKLKNIFKLGLRLWVIHNVRTLRSLNFRPIVPLYVHILLTYTALPLPPTPLYERSVRILFFKEQCSSLLNIFARPCAHSAFRCATSFSAKFLEKLLHPPILFQRIPLPKILESVTFS